MADDTTLSYVYYRMLASEDHELDLYVLNNNEALTSTSNDTQSYGFRYAYKAEDYKLWTENVHQEIEDSSDTAYLVNAYGDYKLGMFTPFFLHSKASYLFDQLYGNRHKFNGAIDIVGRKNLETISIGTKFKWDDQWSAKLEAFQFNKESKNALAYNQATSGTLTGDINESNLGQEYDLTIDFKPREGELFRLGASVFKHGSYFAEKRSSSFLYAQYSLKF